MLFVGLLILAAGSRRCSPGSSSALRKHSGHAAAHGNVAGNPKGLGDRARRAQIVTAHLFGTAAAPVGQAGGENAPETSLDLELDRRRGGERRTTSQAIIASGRSRDENHLSGRPALPGGAIIREILPDRVILAHAGRLETLRLPVAGTSILAARHGLRHGQRGRGTGRPGFKNSLNLLHSQHPQTVAQFLRFTPYVKQGHVEGYHVYPGPNPELFRNRSGLQSGDVVISVNGVKLDNAGRSMQAMEQLRQGQGPVHLVVLRKGQQINVTINPGG